MDSLRTLAERLEIGDYLAWQAEKGDSEERTRPKVVKRIVKDENGIEIQAEGNGGGTYSFSVDNAVNSKSYYHPPGEKEKESVGPIVFTERTDSRDLVSIKRGYYDNRYNP